MANEARIAACLERIGKRIREKYPEPFKTARYNWMEKTLIVKDIYEPTEECKFEFKIERGYAPEEEYRYKSGHRHFSLDINFLKPADPRRGEAGYTQTAIISGYDGKCQVTRQRLEQKFIGDQQRKAILTLIRNWPKIEKIIGKTLADGMKTRDDIEDAALKECEGYLDKAMEKEDAI